MPRTTGSQRPNAGLLLGAAGLVGLAAAVARVPILTPDVWWHLATGRTIAASGLPATDPFSYTLVGRPWLVHEWFADRILWAVYARTGLIGLVWWRGAWIAAATGVSYGLARRGASTWIALPLVACAAFALQRNWIDRPQLWTFVLLPAVVLLLEASRAGARRAVWLLPPLFALWINVHGGFMLGLVIVAAWMAGIASDSRRRGDAGWQLVAVPVLCFAAVLANPHGLAGAIYPLRYVTGALRETIQEERPGALDSGPAWVHLALVLGLVACFAARWRRIPMSHRLTGLVLAVLSLPRVGTWALPFAAERHAPLFLLVGVPLLAWQIEALAPGAWHARWRTVAAWARRPQAWVAAAAIASLAFVEIVRAAPRSNAPSERLLPGRFPEAAARWLLHERLPARLLNPYRWGGFLLFRLAPASQVWIDSRGDLYGQERLREEEVLYRMPAGAEPIAERILARWDPDVIVWYLLTIDFGRLQVHPFARWLLSRPEWRLVFVDAPDRTHPETPAGTTAVFLRVDRRNDAWLARLPAVPLPAALPH